jgi:hypothetical protein
VILKETDQLAEIMMEEDQRKCIIAIDSNCLTYLVTAIHYVLKPCNNYASYQIALFRMWIYATQIHYTNTVYNEWNNISDEIRKAMHDNSNAPIYNQINNVNNLAKVSEVAKEYNKYHKGNKNLNDCKILAEAEILGENIILLTCDDKFYNNLRCRSPSVKLLKPSCCWDILSIPHGAKPKVRPISSNPMSNETWWQW